MTYKGQRLELGGRNSIEERIEGLVGLGIICLDVVPAYKTVWFSPFGIQGYLIWEPSIEVVIRFGVLGWKQKKVKRTRELRLVLLKLLEQNPGRAEKGGSRGC